MVTHVLSLPKVMILLTCDPEAQRILSENHVQLDAAGSNDHMIRLFNTAHPGITYQITTDQHFTIYALKTLNGYY